MIIHVGSTNGTKIEAVRAAIALYPKLFPEPKIIGVDAHVPLFGHPKNLRQTIGGAIKRAKKVFCDCDYSIGLEGGLMEAPFTKSGYMETSACAIFNGKDVYIGLSPAFEWPGNVTKLIVEGKADASQAFKLLGLTDHEKLGAVRGGIVGPLTDGRCDREDFMKYSIMMALIQIEKSAYYQ